MIPRSIIRWLEERAAQQDDPSRKTEPFSVGLDLLDPSTGKASSLRQLMEFVSAAYQDSDKFFSSSGAAEISWDNGKGRFTSPIATESAPNNIAFGHIWRHPKPTGAVLLVPHWNSKESDYQSLCWALSRAGFLVLRMTLPYHGPRQTFGTSAANEMVSANLGMTIRSIRQAVLEARRWLSLLEEDQLPLTVVGVSLGSCIAAIVAAHDPRIVRCALVLSAGRFADVVWTGRATRHVRAALDGCVTLQQLRSIWHLISPVAYTHRIAQRALPTLLLYGTEDKVFLPNLTEELIFKFREDKADLHYIRMDCGHYTMGCPPYNICVLSKLLGFLQGKYDA